MTIPFFSLEQQTKDLKQELDALWQRLLESGAFILGEDVAAFEKNFASFVGTHHAIGVNSGFDALYLTLKSYALGPEDEVIVPANTFIATANAVTLAGARLVLVDVDPHTMLLDFEAVEKAMTPRTKVIIPVHLYGQVVNIDQLRSIVGSKVQIIEDAAQAHGAKLKNKPCGSLGDAGCFSFYPAKNLGCFGDGGIITTNNNETYENLLHLRNYGAKVKYQHDKLGFNSRLDNLQAGVLNIKLPHLSEWNQKRIELAHHYLEHLAKIKDLKLMKRSKNLSSVFHLFVIHTKDNITLQEHLKKRNIHTGRHYPIPIHKQDAYSTYKDLKFPVTEELAAQCLSLPLFPELKKSEVDTVCQEIKDFFGD